MAAAQYAPIRSPHGPLRTPGGWSHIRVLLLLMLLVVCVGFPKVRGYGRDSEKEDGWNETLIWLCVTAWFLGFVILRLYSIIFLLARSHSR